MSIRAVHHLNCATMCPVAGFWLGAGSWSEIGFGRGHMVAHCGARRDRARRARVDRYGLRHARRRGEDGAVDRVQAADGPDPRSGRDRDRPDRGARPTTSTTSATSSSRTSTSITRAACPTPPRVHLHAATPARDDALALQGARALPEGAVAHGPRWEVYTEDGGHLARPPAVTRSAASTRTSAWLPMHGHSRGHSAVIVDAGPQLAGPRRRCVLPPTTPSRAGAFRSGFAAFERATQMDPAARRASVAALRQLRTSYDDIELFCGTNPHEFARYASPLTSTSG